MSEITSVPTQKRATVKAARWAANVEGKERREAKRTRKAPRGRTAGGAA